MDFRLVPLALGLWIGTCITLIVGTKPSLRQIFLWVLCLLVITYLSSIKQKIFRWNKTSLKFAVLGLFIGAGIALVRVLPLYSNPVTLATSQHAVVKVTGETIDDVRRSQVVNALDLDTRDFGTFKFQADHFIYRGDEYKLRLPIQVFVSGEQFDQLKVLPPKSKLLLSGKLSEYDKIRGVGAKLSVTGEVELISAPPNYQYLASNFRSKLHKTLSSFPGSAAGLVPGLALGDVSHLQKSLSLQMKAAGLTHLTAVSGSNVTLLIAIILAVGRKLKISDKSNYIFALLSLGAFVVLVRPQPSVLRASVMGVIMVAALMSKSPRSAIPALVGSVICLIFIDPWLSISYGFALSVFATAGLLLWASALLKSIDSVLPRQIPQWLVLGLVVTISAQVAVFPILVSIGSPISLASLPANLISVPLSGPTMIFGLLAAITYPIALLSKLFAFTAVMCAQGIVWCAEFFSAQEWLVIPWPKGMPGTVLAITMILFGLKTKLSWSNLSGNQKQILFTIWGCLVFIIWQPPLSVVRNWVPVDWQVASCDVGQGDATVIKVDRHQAIVVDVGGDPVLIDKCLTDLKVRKIPLLLLTHFHADHVVGLPGALEGRVIGQIRISPLANPPLTTKFVEDVLQENRFKAQILAYPEYLKVGDVEIFCIWPKRDPNVNSNTPNNASVSLLVKTKELTLLLPGDIEPIAQDAILKLAGNINVAVVKVPHHGSRYQSVDFARATKAKLAVISVGRENKYGHPSMDTIWLYQTIGAKVIRTDEHGSIAIWAKANRVKVQSEK